MNVLLTGGSGFLGTWVAKEFAKQGHRVYAVVRKSGTLNARQRLERLWHHDSELMEALGSCILPLEGDITQPDLGLSPADKQQVLEQVDVVVHAAADTSINRTQEETRTTNVIGTHNVLQLAQAINKTRPLQRLVHVSTTYVAGTRQGRILEEELEAPGFNSPYEQSKFDAEQEVRSRAELLQIPFTVIRPSQMVGDSQTGEIFTFNTVYYPLKLYLKCKLRTLPVDKDAKLNIVPVDFVAAALVKSVETDWAAGRTFHLTLPREKQPTVQELVEYVRSWAAANLNIDLPKPIFTPLPLASKLGARHNLSQTTFANPKSFANNMRALAPYFDDKHLFDTSNTRQLMGSDGPAWRSFLPNMLAYAIRRGFLNHTGRTVFEQMQTRLASKRNLITYHDITSAGVQVTDGTQMRRKIRNIAAGLLAVGIIKGSRVALVGVNSSDYTAVDSAIGLIGAISVPLYYTSPPADVAQLIERSSSQLLFVGTATLAKAAAQGAFGVPGILMPTAGTDETWLVGEYALTPWEVFLQIGEANLEALDTAPAASLEDVATIRYTSGTTGLPKGTMFTQDQLAWMGRTMPAILDWRTRNAPLRYLSFLPMSHVVEGILIAYAGYYALTQVDYWCLNQFDRLVEMLPKVRPTIFFSVPRFYEKVWNQFVATSAGKRWLAMPEGPAKRAFGRICKSVILRKAGLDRCRQLIVGSAPIRLELLENFRKLGIEIHNAFGLTEAPLITLNRLGENDLGSLGAALPDTDVAVDEKGEILMRGPQVFVGYDGLDTPATDEDGWLHTGDLGHFSPAGNLVIEGRSKELVITSYGKNVQSEKIEALLKGIPGTSEAMLVGDGRPYCTALIWLEEEAKADFDSEVFDAAVLDINTQLSHPEQLKRWAVMEVAPGLGNGELTPNLKLKRNVISKRCEEAIEALYAPELGQVPGALHAGAAR